LPGIFKYKELNKKLECKCPPADIKPVKITAYRWIFEDLKHFNNHHPPLKIEPNRLADSDDCEHNCDGYALSLFTSADKAEKKLKRFLDKKPLLAEVLGNCIAEVNISETDGEGDTPEKKYGHFNFHEYENVNLNFTFIKKLKIE
jgi:hypothetical protein